MTIPVLLLLIILAALLVARGRAPRDCAHAWEAPRDRLRQSHGDIDWGIAMSDLPASGHRKEKR
jgi:hypothetical protein